MTARAEYAVRAMLQLAADGEGALVKSDDLAARQQIPPHFLVDILTDLRKARLVRSQRGAVGGYALARSPDTITIADVLRCIDGPLASVHDTNISELDYTGPTEALAEVWRALRASIRSVLEGTTLADVVSGRLPAHVLDLAGDYRSQELDRRGPR